MTAPPEVIAAAREYFEQGYQVVAVRSDKRPFGTNWRRAHNLDEVLKLLEGSSCVAIGFLGGELNHWIVPVDFDTAEGDEWFRANCRFVGIDPDDFPTVITPGKRKADGSRTPGLHRYMSDVRQCLGNSTGPLLARLGIDIRGAGHAMLPPSPHPDEGRYAWAPRHALVDFSNGIPPVPDFLYDAIEARPRAEEPPAEPVQGNGADHGAEAQFRAPPPSGGAAGGDYQARAEAYCRQALTNSKARLLAAPDGHRNAELNTQALGLGHLAHFGVFGEGEALSALMAACEANGLMKDPINGGPVKCHATFYSGWNDGIKDPWPLPDDEPPRPGFGTGHAWTGDFGAGTESNYSAKGADYSGEKQEQAQKPLLNWRDYLRWADELKAQEATPLVFRISGFWPKVWLSLLNGDGGSGKTTLLTQIFGALSAGTSIFGMATLLSQVMLLSTEEDDEIAIRRLNNMPNVGHFPIFNLLNWPTGCELCWTKRDGIVEPLPFLATLREMIGDLKPELVGLDHVGDLFLINENNKMEVNAALQLLRPLHAEFKTDFILGQHISKAGMASGRKDAGTPQWSNKSRWRAAIFPPGLDEEPTEDEVLSALETQARTVEVVKDNYGNTLGTRLELLREGWHFVEERGELDKARTRSLRDGIMAFVTAMTRSDPQASWPANPLGSGSLVGMYRKSLGPNWSDFNATVEAVQILIDQGDLIRFDRPNRAGEKKPYLRLPKREDRE